MPFFSIIIPVYNVKPYLRGCLDSILAQTFTDWEVICVDDGSTDGCGEILEDYARRDPRLRVIHQENCGVEVARNIGYSYARGERIIFMDGDDAIKPICLEVHKNALSGQPANTISYSAHIASYEDGHYEDCSSVYRECSNNRDLIFSMLKDGWSPIIHSWVWPRNILSKGGGWRTDIVANDDFEFSFRHLSLGNKVVFVNEALAIYSQHNYGLSHMVRDTKFYLSILEATSARECFALRIEDSAAMRNAVAQMWYRVLFSPDFIVVPFARKWIWSRLKRIGLPQCSCIRVSSKKEFILKAIGVRGLLVVSIVYERFRENLNEVRAAFYRR